MKIDKHQSPAIFALSLIVPLITHSKFKIFKIFPRFSIGVSNLRSGESDEQAIHSENSLNEDNNHNATEQCDTKGNNRDVAGCRQ